MYLEDQEQLAPSSENSHAFINPISSKMPGSSPLGPPSTMGSRKPKKPPPITPKRFTRFFTPRSSVHGKSDPAKSMGKSGRQLQALTRTAVNRRANNVSQTPRKTVNFADDMVIQQLETPKSSTRKRKLPYLSPESSPVQSSPIKRSRLIASPAFTILEDEDAASEESTLDCLPEEPVIPDPIRRLRTSGPAMRVLQRSFGGLRGVGRGFLYDNCASWQDHTANFYSSAEDFHQLPSAAPPFCTASCNTNSLVGVGDEEGSVHLFDTDATASFATPHLTFRAHTNAVMDLQFSSDDRYLATASGDQTAQIIDVATQRCVNILAKHTASLKQVCFQPGDDKIVATSSRDGTVQIWDLRCSGNSDAVHTVWGHDAPYASTIRTLSGAHSDRTSNSSAKGTPTGLAHSRDSTKSEALSRRGEASITALSFLGPGRQHLLLTASDASTCVKLWDIRGRYSRRGPAVPISTTSHPESHNRHRHFAINSLTLGGNGSRLYALSKDNTVYTYATSHLILGHAPELAISDSSRQKHIGTGKEGLGPIYGFRHKNFHAGSFYVKASLRKARDDQSELLAVGSTDGCPVLFPTDETFLKRDHNTDNDDSDGLPQHSPQSPFTTRASVSRTSSGSSFSSMMRDTIPIYEHGTPLIRGHDTEVTSVTWATNGALVSIGDDYKVRCWREGQKARELRLGGEGEGKRWRAGWAVVEEGWDDDED